MVYVIFIAIASFGLAALLYAGKDEHSRVQDSEAVCSSCGFRNDKSARFCSGCGIVLENQSRPELRAAAFSWLDFSALFALVVSFVLVLGVPSMGSSLIWADWSAIPIGTYVRVAAAILLTTIIPGYFLLRALDWRGQFRGPEFLVLAYLLSVFIVPMWSMLGSAAGLTLNRFAFSLEVALNLILVSVFIVARLIVGLRNRSWIVKPQAAMRSVFASGTARASRRLYSIIVMVGVLGFVLALSYRLYAFPPYLIGDQWPHNAVARLYEVYGNQLFVTKLIPYSGYNYYPRWFHIYLASLYALSGAPSTNTYFLINFVNVFGLFALYIVAVSFFKKDAYAPGVASFAVAVALFAGFGWVYDLWLKSSGLYAGSALSRLYQTSISTYDVWLANTYFGSAHPELTSGLQMMAMPALLMLLWVGIRGDLKGWTRYILIALLTALAYLGHIAEGGMFVAILLFAVIVSREIAGAWKVGFAAFAGVALTGVLGFIMPDRYYVSLGAYYAALAGSLLTVPVGFARQRLSKRATESTQNPRQGMWLAIVLSAVGFTVWLALFVLWRLSGYSSFNVWWDCPTCTRTVPPYMYPSRFGILGLLGIPAIAFALLAWRKETRGLSLVCGFALVALALGRLWMIPGLYRLTGIEEFRWNKYVALALVLPVALLLWKGLAGTTQTKMSRRILAGFLLSIILFSGFASTVLYGEFTQLAFTGPDLPNPDLTAATQPHPEFGPILSHQLSADELAAIQYLADNLRKDQVVAVMGNRGWEPSGYAYMKVTSFAGFLRNQTFSLKTLYGMKNSTGIYSKLADAKVSFVYLSSDDLAILVEHPEVFKAITALPVTFKNSQVTIYAFE